jgi:prophage tail gpP-like protein
MSDDTVQLIVGGQIHDDWESYEVDSDLLIPADAWRVSLVLRSGTLPEGVKPEATFELRVGGDPVMVGRIDEVGEEAAKGGLHVDIAGRDGAAVLLDCSSPIFTAQMVTLADVIAKIVIKLGIDKSKISADSPRAREKINVEPGETAWETLVNAAEANGLWPWFEPDGTLVVGGPDYDATPVATLVVRKNGQGNNTLRLSRRRSIAGRYSEMTVLGQKRGTGTEEGKHGIVATEKDIGVSWYRPRITVDYEAESEKVARARAKKLLADSRLKGMTLAAVVQGHRIVAPGEPGDGLLWKPGQRVRVISEPHGIDDIYFLMARKFTGGRHEGQRTHLTLKEDKTWVLDAHPHKKNHRLGKNAAPLQILDASKGAAQ